MVKEVEIFNTIEAVKTGTLYPPYTTDPSVDMLTGFLTDDGKLLTVDVNREFSFKHIRMIYLWYAVVDLTTRTVNYTLLETKELSYENHGGPSIQIRQSSHSFDLSAVLTIPRRVNISPAVNEINIDLFTYEANISGADGTAVYGKKRLSVPFSSSLDSGYELVTSTDGWYPMGVVDYAIRDKNYSYTDYIEAGDIIFWVDGPGTGIYDSPSTMATGKLYVAQERTNESPLTEGAWVEVVEADLLR